MKTVITNIIDGKNVIVGFGDPVIDPKATQPVVEPLLNALDEVTEIKNILVQMEGKNAVIRKALANLKNPEMINIPSIVAENIKAKEDAEIYNRAKEQDLTALWHGVRQKKVELIQSEAVYLTPKAGEIITPEGPELDAMTALFAETKTDRTKKLSCEIVDNVVVNPALIPDLRGKTYHIDNAGTWEKVDIIALGVEAPTGGILPDDLTPEQSQAIHEQSETLRIAALSAEEKTAEYDNRVASVVGQASAMRSGLEIQGVSEADALAQSQEFYNTEVAKLNLIYGV